MVKSYVYKFNEYMMMLCINISFLLIDQLELYSDKDGNITQENSQKVCDGILAVNKNVILQMVSKHVS